MIPLRKIFCCVASRGVWAWFEMIVQIERNRYDNGLMVDTVKVSIRILAHKVVKVLI